MKRGSLLVASVAVILLPVQALAAVCFALTAGSTSVGTVVVELGTSAGAFSNLIGEFVNTTTYCGFAENAELTGSFRTSVAGFRVGLNIAGSTNCLPIALNALVQANGVGTGTVDVPSQSDFTTVAIAPAVCPVLVQPEE